MIQKIKAEIERLKAEQVQYSDIYGSVDDYARASMCEGMVSTLSHLLSFIESLEKEQPQGLDEAAEKNFETMEVLEHENIFDVTHNRIFKAGAEWMASQGYTTTGKIIDEMAYDSLQVNGLIPNNVFTPNEEVIVQIRKAK